MYYRLDIQKNRSSIARQMASTSRTPTRIAGRTRTRHRVATSRRTPAIAAGPMFSQRPQLACEAYDHIEIPPINPE
jgi:hypothetical protein